MILTKTIIIIIIIIIINKQKILNASDQGVNTMALAIESISLKQNFSRNTTNFKYYSSFTLGINFSSSM